jgi:hypothetical protein
VVFDEDLLLSLEVRLSAFPATFFLFLPALLVNCIPFYRTGRGGREEPTAPAAPD